jgi:uncharacterized repeat protein (TIGR01451 family)
MKPFSLKHLAAAMLSAIALPSLAAPVLLPSATVPTELQLGAYAVFTLAVHNSGNHNASGVVLRMPLPAGLQVQAPLPTGCVVASDPFIGLPGQVRQIRCSAGLVPARRARSYRMVVQAPPLGQPMLNVMHRVQATATNAGTALSPQVLTQYRHFDVPVTPGLTWELRSCNNGTAGPLAYGICPASSEVVADIVLAAGGYLNDTDGQVSLDDRWLQLNPHVLRIDWTIGGLPAAVSHYTAIDSRCLRGPGQTIPQPGEPVVYLASTICRR